jgi:ABC-type branched-subunit amino acid transport system permease subunit
VTLLDPGFWAFVGLMAGLYTIFALGLQVQYGYAGLLNFGHVASMAIAAYVMAIGVVRFGLPEWVSALAGIAAAVVAGILVGLTTLRLRADYFAIVTICFSEIVRYILLNWAAVTGGPQGTIELAGSGRAAAFNAQWESTLAQLRDWLDLNLNLQVSRDTIMLVLIWLVAVAALITAALFLRTPWGRVLRAIREDEDAARALGKNAFAAKLQALALGAALAGIAGVLYGLQFSFFTPQDFEPLITFFAWIVLILSGMARIGALPLGALIFGILFAGTRFLEFWPLSELDSAHRAYLRLIVIGLLLIGFMFYRPQGLLGRRQEMLLE